MSSAAEKIQAMQRNMNISMLSPLKVVGGLAIVSTLIIIATIYWVKPNSLRDEHGKMSNPRLLQYTIAIIVGMASLGWLGWNFYTLNI